MELAAGWCERCHAEVDFERPVCPDHLDECPELICAVCCAAYVGGEVVAYPAAINTTPAREAVTPAA